MNDPLDSDKTLEPQKGEEHSSSLSPGFTLGQYRIIRLLGRGGMGEVYLAENIHNRKQCALKVLHAELAADKRFVARFTVESRVMMDLRHPHIVEVHHMGEDRGRYFLTMDYVAGPDDKPWTLEEELGSRQDAKTPRDRWVGAMALQICDALSYAHTFESGAVVHRDLKPSNVLLDSKGDARVSDFGLAKVMGDKYLQSVIEKSIKLSMAGQLSVGDGETGRKTSSARAILGTYDYMSPEQQAGREVDVRSDIYAFGVMLYKMLTGRMPKGAWKNPSALKCSRRWDAIVRRCMNEEPSDRYPSVAVLAKDIRAVSFGGLKVFGMAALALVGIAFIVFAGRWGWMKWDVHKRAKTAEVEMAGRNEAVISGLMAEAESALASGDLKKAGEEIAALESVGGRHAVAADLRKRFESQASARETNQRYAEASVARDGIADLNPDRGQGFGEKLDGLEVAWRAAEAARGKESWGEALSGYDAVLAGCRELEGLESSRQDARAQREKADEAKKNAAMAGAAELAKEQLDASGTRSVASAGLYDQGKFEEARVGWGEAARQYAAAGARAEQVAGYLKAKATWEEALGAALGGTRSVASVDEYLGRYGGEAWEEVQKQRRLGAASEQDPVAGKKAYEAALAGLPEAVKAGESGKRAAKERERQAGVKAAYDAALAEAQSYEKAGRWKEAAASGEKALASGWTYTALAAALLERVKKHLLPQPGENITIDLGAGVKLEFVWIPPGEFMMGSPESESGRYSDEGPQHRVTISKGFWMGKYEVTQRQWEQVMGSNQSHFKEAGLDAPVEQVSWNDTQSFCEGLNGRFQMENLRCRLPSEAEWEYACRAGTATRFYTGDQDSDLARAGWYSGNSGSTTHPVGGKAANAWGLYDMHGNVWEWCADWYGDYGSGSSVDPAGSSSGSGRVLRGGSWDYVARLCRSASRFGLDIAFRGDVRGLRVVVVR